MCIFENESVCISGSQCWLERKVCFDSPSPVIIHLIFPSILKGCLNTSSGPSCREELWESSVLPKTNRPRLKHGPLDPLGSSCIPCFWQNYASKKKNSAMIYKSENIRHLIGCPSHAPTYLSRLERNCWEGQFCWKCCARSCTERRYKGHFLLGMTTLKILWQKLDAAP